MNIGLLFATNTVEIVPLALSLIIRFGDCANCSLAVMTMLMVPVFAGSGVIVVVKVGAFVSMVIVGVASKE